MPTVFANVDALTAAAGTDLGHTDWIAIDQDRINLFADATGDHQWIHVDVEAAKQGPFGAPIAHGYLTLALTNLFLPQLIQVENISMGINYGVNKVRFPNPVRAGSRVRGAARLGSVDEVAGGVQALITVTVEIEGEPKPACVVENVTRYMR
jgi:acyl dehydratase